MPNSSLRDLLQSQGQDHVLRFWDDLSKQAQASLTAQIESIDFDLVNQLTETWIRNTPAPLHFDSFEPIPAIAKATLDRPDAREAWEAGEEALRAGRVGLILVAGGQGTRLGYDGPKGAFPIGPVTGRTLFEYHADKIHHYNERYGCVLPWYIMVGETNESATRDFFRQHDHFGLGKENITFFKQTMMPCVSDDGKFFLETKDSLSMNPNGHGGSIPALVENGILDDADERGIDTLSYFQVDNWAVKLADPFFIGYHLLRNGEMSSKIQRKTDPHEAAGVFCLCDGKFRVIEYTELDIYPQLLDTNDDGTLIHFAANAAIHMLDTAFIRRVYDIFHDFPWHCSHKKIPYIAPDGQRATPGTPNGYKFETFVFDALQYSQNEPVGLEIDRLGEFTPTKQMTGAGSVEKARQDMARYWGGWLKKAGCTTDLTDAFVEINPRFAFTEEQFLEKAANFNWPAKGNIVIGPDGSLSQ
jgi:UDP-N-acetylglucosamine/UDP-N-acetylgalactosamine diphosphorylase